MRSLILVAHGSRREASNEEIRQLTRKLITKSSASFDRISCAFLELAEPSIPDSIEQAVHQGAREILVLPYFLSAGRHVTEDIPRTIAQKRQQYPQVRIVVTPYLGCADEIVDLLLKLALR